MTHTPLRILGTRLHADPSRVVLRPFYLGWQAASAPPERAERLVKDVLALSDEQALLEYDRVLADFGERHWQTEQLFDERFHELGSALRLCGGSLPDYKRRLIAAYFCHEYSYAAAAIMNPSIVPHPDQSGMVDGACRFVMSLRTVGEGHISSVSFREGIASSDGTFTLWPHSSFATALTLDDATKIGNGAVAVHRHPESSLSNSVIFPMTEAQRNGLEDLRLVQFTEDDGTHEWIGTYTAYSGTAIRSELMRTRDFRQFLLEPIHGNAGRNKGMALFPKRLGDGRYAMIGRQDGKNLFLLRSDRLECWDDEGVLLMEPRYPWEFIQIGNCGSPVLTDAGWIMLTHGVGPMRKYALGCALLDKDDPTKVLARSREPLLTAEDADRAGYVPNVVYTCGMMAIGDQFLIPYGFSDSGVGFATISTAELLRHME